MVISNNGHEIKKSFLLLFVWDFHDFRPVVCSRYHVVIILTGHGLYPGVAYSQHAYLYCRLVFINTVKRALQYIPSWGENEENTLNNKVIKIRTQNKLTSCVAQWIKSLLHNLTIISWWVRSHAVANTLSWVRHFTVITPTLPIGTQMGALGHGVPW